MTRDTTVAARVTALATAPMEDLWVLWDQYFRSRPQYPNRAHIVSRLAYKIQEEAHGGLNPRLRNRLIDVGARQSKIKRRRSKKTYEFAPGTVLLREWGDRDHRVTVTPEGHFEYEGQTYRSLTAVARQITGTHWSGPLFFGLTE
ncbi:DUF2924 domain-containing protein [Orrella sp. 11846]|uniref:DUF2924 domain-containing protein n=1 Tax=Orrella sp. 11846 TaxID=3409913 RepID=UPI003B5BECA2